MTYTLSEIRGMLEKVTYWPVLEVGARPNRIDCHAIISQLIDQLEEAKKVLKSVTSSDLRVNGDDVVDMAREVLEKIK